METTKLSSVSRRQTKYVKAVYEALHILKHATNLQILMAVQTHYPEVSITTIHRVTARLKEHGMISCAPKPTDGSERYDITAAPHHHFMCVSCSRICDIAETQVANNVMEQLKGLSGECALVGTLTLRGICKDCKHNSDQKENSI